MIFWIFYIVMIVVTGRIVIAVVEPSKEDRDSFAYLGAAFFGILWPIAWAFGLVALCIGWRPRAKP